MDSGIITIIVAILGSSALTTIVQAIVSAIQKKKGKGDAQSAHLKAIDEKIDKITRLQDEQYLSILRLTIMSEEMPMSERLIAGKKYINRGGNGDVKKALHKLEEQCEAGRHEAS